MNKLTLLYLCLTIVGLLLIWWGSKKRWVYLGLIIPTFVVPGLLKAIDAHFANDIQVDCKKLCDLTSVETVFYFFSYSRLFIRSLGILQLISGLLLFSKRLRLIGLLACLGISLFINLLNISFWGMSNVTIFMFMISAMIISYLYLDYKTNIKALLKIETN